jgi:hypothetical protein
MWINRRGLVVAAGAVLAVVLCACSAIQIIRSSPGDSGVSLQPDLGGGLPEVPIVTVDLGFRSGISTPREVVVRDRAAWEELWTDHIAGQPQTARLPDVDFTSHMVLAVFLGERPSSGYAITILDATERDEELVVDVEVTVPPPGMSELAVLTRPYHIVMVSRTEGSVEFVATETARLRAR